MSIWGIGVNARKKRLLNSLVRGVLFVVDSSVTSTELRGTRLDGALVDLAAKTTCTAAMLAPPKLFNISNNSLAKFHKLVCEELSSRLNPTMNLAENVEVFCRFVASCMAKGYSNYIGPASDNENWVEYLTRASWVCLTQVVSKNLFASQRLSLDEEVAFGKAFITGYMQVFVLYSDVLKAWDNEMGEIDSEEDYEQKLKNAIDELEYVARKSPYQVVDWCRRHPDDGYVLTGKVGLFNVPARYRKWDGPYGITISGGIRKTVYNVFFRDLISDIDKVIQDVANIVKREGNMITKILATPSTSFADAALAREVVTIGMKASIEEAASYIREARLADGAGLFDDLEGGLPYDSQNEDLEPVGRDEPLSAEDKDLQTNAVSRDEVTLNGDVPPWYYESGCYFEVDIEGHNATPEENRYLGILRHLYNQKTGLFEEMFKYAKSWVDYDWKTFCRVCFAALMTAALMDKDYRLLLEYQVHVPFACAMKRFDAKLYKIFDTLFFHARRQRQENFDEHKELFESTKHLCWSDKPLDCVVDYMEDWLWGHEENDGTILACRMFRECVPNFVEVFDKYCEDV